MSPTIPTDPATTLADRALLRLSGEDVRGFLQGLVTNDLDALAPGAPVWAGLLTPQGKALFDFILWANGEDVLVDCERDVADALMRRLMLYRLRRAIVIGREEAQAVHWSSPAKAGAQPFATVEIGPRPSPGNDPRLPELGRRWLAPANAPAVGWHAHRLSLGVTEGLAELGTDKTLWLECNAGELHGVSFTKGCYVGQENTARMHHRSKVGRRLVVVPVGAVDARIAYPELGLAVAHRRMDALGDAVVPNWLADAIAPATPVDLQDIR